jgi:hypothetical protein
MAGWIKIHRDIAKHWIFQDAEKFKWWIDLLIMASHEDNKLLVGDALIDIRRGQLVASLSFLGKRWNVSKRTVMKFLDLLEFDQMCNRCTNRKVTILTICNYESYQADDSDKVTDEVTDKYPIGKRLVTELKNVEECKRINITTTAGAYVCTCEELAARYRAENNWSEVGIMIHAKSIDEVISLFEEFVAISKHDEKSWNDYSDFKRHFRQWAGKQIQQRPAKPIKKEPKVISGAAIFDVYGKQ